MLNIYAYRFYKSEEEYKIEILSRTVLKLTDQVGKLLQYIAHNTERIDQLQQDLYELFPEKEIIDTVFDDESEKLEALRRYANTGSMDQVFGDGPE